MSYKGKIINDPVYGFLKFPEEELLNIIEHPWFQRLRNIRQMGMAHLVYPGAVHTRFHHSLGACHLMGIALEELKLKGIPLTKEDSLSAKIAILMHDIGHGPFSHALEHSLVDGINHETLSLMLLKRMNEHMNGVLDGAIAIHKNLYPKKYLHQLVSSQLDVDRMDYLSRDSFFTGVSEGVISYDRILQMLTVNNDEIMVEEKGVHSVEKFIIARRLMYWQVYLHKAVLGAEMLLVNILKRAKELALNGHELFATPSLRYFLYNSLTKKDFDYNPDNLLRFCELDDNDVLSSIKVWMNDKDEVLARLCKMMMERRLYKTQLSSLSLEEMLAEKKEILHQQFGWEEATINYFAFTGTTSTSTYNTDDEKITIALKNGNHCDISEVENPLVNQALAKPVHKNYICYLQP